MLDGGFWMDTCFLRMLVEAGIMTELEADTYHSIFKSMTSFVLYPTFVARIDVAPEVALQRVVARAEKHPERKEEAKRLTPEYMGALDDQISGLCHEFLGMGIRTEHIFWDESREAAKQREQAVKGLARMIRNNKPVDPFLNSWRRRVG